MMDEYRTRNCVCRHHEAEMLDSSRGLQSGCHELCFNRNRSACVEDTSKQPKTGPQSPFCTLIFVLVVF